MIVTKLIILNLQDYICPNGVVGIPELHILIERLSAIDGVPFGVLSTLDMPSFYAIKKIIKINHTNFEHFHSNLHLFNVHLLRFFSLALRGKFLYDRYDQYQPFLFQKFGNSDGSFNSYINKSEECFDRVEWRFDEETSVFLKSEIKTVQSNLNFFRKVIDEKKLSVESFSTVLPEDNSTLIIWSSTEGLDRALTLATSIIL